jgi:hypothetical protein
VDEDRSRTRVLREAGTVIFERHRHSRQELPERSGLAYDSDETWTVSVDEHDPTSTRARSDGEVTMERPGWKVATRGSLELTGDQHEFHLAIVVSAYHDDRMVFTRAWKDSIPREWA